MFNEMTPMAVVCGGGHSAEGEITFSATKTLKSIGFTPKTVVVAVQASNGYNGILYTNNDSNTAKFSIHSGQNVSFAQGTQGTESGHLGIVEITDGGFYYQSTDSSWQKLSYFVAFD